MKASIATKLALGLALAVAIFVSSLRASLAEVLAPLPVEDLSAATAPQAEEQDVVIAGSRASAPDRATRHAFEPISSNDLLSAIVIELEDSMRPNGSITLNPLRELPDLSNYAKPFSATLLNIPSRLGRGNLLLRFQIENEKGVLGEWSVPFGVHVYSEVWYARAHLRAGNLATASDFEIREVDLLNEPDAVPARMEVLMRHEYSRDIAPGKPLVWKDLSQRSLVRKGDIVEVTAINGLMAISMRAVARQDGSDGDVILLRNVDSSKDFPARVVSEGRAEVIF